MPRTELTCTYKNCTAVFNHSERYENHLRTHSGERPFKCTFDGCEKTYSRSFHLKRHEKIHEMMFRCSVPGCSMILKTKATLIKHQDLVHEKKPKTYKCSECNEVFPKHSMLSRHSYTHTGIKAYKCNEPDCDKSFSMASLLKKHMKHHIGYLCKESDCSKSFPRWSLLLKHKRECHPRIFRCDICDKDFKHLSNLKSHSLTHMTERDVFRCTVPKCTRFYTEARNLAAHMKNFHKTYTISCPEGNCYRFLKTEEELEKHINRRHRRRMFKKKKPKRPDFAEILSGFAKGSKKDLNPHLSNEILETEQSTVCLNSSDTIKEETTDTDDSHEDISYISSESKLEEIEAEVYECQVYSDSNLDDEGSDSQCPKVCKNVSSTISAKDVNSKEICHQLSETEDTKNDLLDKDLNKHMSNAIYSSEIEKSKSVERICLNSHIISKKEEQVEEKKSCVPLSRKRSEDEFVEIEVLLNNLPGDKIQHLDNENYRSSYKAEADNVWISSGVSNTRVK